jgi:D-tyrosyl-tRNA(Tyr) deacylase
MIALLQRVARAQVRVDDRITGAIDAGLLVFLCAERGDTEAQADAMLAKVLACRVFADDAGKMNRSVRDISGGVLIVSQFTLAANTSSGNRPSFSGAAPPDEGRRLYEYVIQQASRLHPRVASGEFGAMMQVELVNDGPVTLWLQVKPKLALSLSPSAGGRGEVL